MQRKPGYPVANCNIKMPDSVPLTEVVPCDDDGDRRQQLINFGHTQWGFNNWSWTVNKQDLDFVDFANGKYCCGVAAFVCVSVKSLDIRRENVGYATCTAPLKGSAIHQARKCAVTNALRETLLSFGGSVATELLELLESHRPEPAPAPEPLPQPENNPNLANKDPKNLPKNRKETIETNPVNMRPLPPAIKNVPTPVPVPAAMPLAPGLPGARPPAPRPPAPRPPSNEGRERDAEDERAERRRRQRQAQEEFRLKQMQRQRTDDSSELKNDGSSIDRLLMAIPTQDIVIEESGKRKTPPPEGSSKKRSTMSRLDIVETD